MFTQTYFKRAELSC